jgi:hypothetical protein
MIMGNHDDANAITSTGFPNRMAGEIDIDFEIVIADGERGRRLARAQADSILEVIEWFSRRYRQGRRRS